MSTKIPALTEVSVPDLADLTYVVDVSDATDDATGSSRKLSLSRLLGALHPAQCEGRLTLESGVPVSAEDMVAKSTVYLTAGRVSVFDGTRWLGFALSELSLSLTGLTTGLPYDVFLNYNAGTPALVATPWTNGTTRATALTLQNGVKVKSGTTTHRYLGTFVATSATTTEDSEWNRYLYNEYNQVARIGRREDAFTHVSTGGTHTGVRPEWIGPGIGLRQKTLEGRAGPAQTCSVSFARLPRPGSLIVVLAGLWDDGGIHEPTTCTDNQGNTYTKAIASTDHGGTLVSGSMIWYTIAGQSTGTFTVTAGVAATDDYIVMQAQEFFGLVTSSVLDRTVSSFSATPATSISTGNTAATTVANEIAVAVGVFNGNSPWTQNTAVYWQWLYEPDATNWVATSGLVAWLTATGVQNSTWTLDVAKGYATVLATFKGTASYASTRVNFVLGTPQHVVGHAACNMHMNSGMSNALEIMLGLDGVEFAPSQYGVSSLGLGSVAIEETQGYTDAVQVPAGVHYVSILEGPPVSGSGTLTAGVTVVELRM